MEIVLWKKSLNITKHIYRVICILHTHYECLGICFCSSLWIGQEQINIEKVLKNKEHFSENVEFYIWNDHVVIWSTPNGYYSLLQTLLILNHEIDFSCVFEKMRIGVVYGNSIRACLCQLSVWMLIITYYFLWKKKKSDFLFLPCVCMSVESEKKISPCICAA